MRRMLPRCAQQLRKTWGDLPSPPPIRHAQPNTQRTQTIILDPSSPPPPPEMAGKKQQKL
eukprot:4791530-Pyramimonas_sp.AAC.1